MSRQVELDPRWKSKLGAATLADQERQDREAEEARQGNSIEARLARVGHVVSSFWGPIVLLDFFLGFCLMWVQYPLGGAQLYAGLVVALVMVVVGMFRRATLEVQWGGVLALLSLAMLTYLIVVSTLQHMPWSQRTSKFLLLFIMCAVLATGRMNIRSMIVGGMVGALVNVPMFYLNIAPNEYPPYMTGFYGDKNISGMYYALWGILGLQVLKGRWRIAWYALSVVLVFLTGSRTSLAALFVAIAWVLLRNRVGMVARLVLFAMGYFGLVYAVSNLAENSAFGDRTGTDWYRHQIEIGMQAKADITPWYGLGLNQGFVNLGNRIPRFHDSYLQAFVEGGYPFLWFTLVLFFVVGMGIFDNRLVVSFTRLTSEAAIIVVMVCAWKLGEVFMTFGAFFVLGICLAHRLGRPVEHDAAPWEAAHDDDRIDEHYVGAKAWLAGPLSASGEPALAGTSGPGRQR